MTQECVLKAHFKASPECVKSQFAVCLSACLPFCFVLFVQSLIIAGGERDRDYADYDALMPLVNFSIKKVHTRLSSGGHRPLFVEVISITSQPVSQALALS